MPHSNATSMSHRSFHVFIVVSILGHIDATSIHHGRHISDAFTSIAHIDAQHRHFRLYPYAHSSIPHRCHIDARSMLTSIHVVPHRSTSMPHRCSHRCRIGATSMRHIDATSIHIDATSMPHRYDIRSTSKPISHRRYHRRCHIDSAWMPHRCHFDVTIDPLRCHIDATSMPHRYTLMPHRCHTKSTSFISGPFIFWCSWPLSLEGPFLSLLSSFSTFVPFTLSIFLFLFHFGSLSWALFEPSLAIPLPIYPLTYYFFHLLLFF